MSADVIKVDAIDVFAEADVRGEAVAIRILRPKGRDVIVIVPAASAVAVAMRMYIAGRAAAVGEVDR